MEPRPQLGTGTRLVHNRYGSSTSAVRRGGGGFDHPFRPSLQSNAILIGWGLIDVYEPKIGKVPISGKDALPQPALKLKSGLENELGQSWVCVEVEPNAAGFLDASSRVEIVHTNRPYSLSNHIGRTPLVAVLWSEGRALQALPIVYFNLRYQRINPPPEGGATQHLFR